jgi:hypothetical protein
MDDDLTPADYRTTDKRLHRDTFGSGFAYLNSVGPVDYDRVDELPPPVLYGLLTMKDVIALVGRYRTREFSRAAELERTATS